MMFIKYIQFDWLEITTQMLFKYIWVSNHFKWLNKWEGSLVLQGDKVVKCKLFHFEKFRTLLCRIVTIESLRNDEGTDNQKKKICIFNEQKNDFSTLCTPARAFSFVCQPSWNNDVKWPNLESCGVSTRC